MDDQEFTVVINYQSAVKGGTFFWNTGDKVDIYEWLWGEGVLDWNQIERIQVTNVEIQPWPGEE